MKISRRSVLKLSGTATIALLAAACAQPAPPAAPAAGGGGAPPPPAAPPAAPTAAPAAAAPKTAPQPAASDARAKWEAELPKGEVTVTFWHGTDATTNKLYTETFIAGYKKLRPNYTIQEEA